MVSTPPLFKPFVHEGKCGTVFSIFSWSHRFCGMFMVSVESRLRRARFKSASRKLSGARKETHLLQRVVHEKWQLQRTRAPPARVLTDFRANSLSRGSHRRSAI